MQTLIHWCQKCKNIFPFTEVINTYILLNYAKQSLLFLCLRRWKLSALFYFLLSVIVFN